MQQNKILADHHEKKTIVKFGSQKAHWIAYFNNYKDTKQRP